MSTRVEKGGTKFKPALKTARRPTGPNASTSGSATTVPSERHESSAPVSHTSENHSRHIFTPDEPIPTRADESFPQKLPPTMVSSSSVPTRTAIVKSQVGSLVPISIVPSRPTTIAVPTRAIPIVPSRTQPASSNSVPIAVESSRPLAAQQPAPMPNPGPSMQTRPSVAILPQPATRSQGTSTPIPIVARRSSPLLYSQPREPPTIEDPIGPVASSSGTNAVLQPSNSTNEQPSSPLRSQPTPLPTLEAAPVTKNPKQKSAKARGKEKAVEPVDADDSSLAPHKRKRKAKTKSSATQAEYYEETDENDADQDADETPAKKRRRSSKSGTATPSGDSPPKAKRTRPRKSKDIDIDRPIPSNAPQTVDAEGNGHFEDPLVALVSLENPGDPLDPTSTTMASLCDDPGAGRISNRFFETRSKWRVYRQRRKDEDRELRKLNRLRELGETVDEDEDARRQRLEDRAREKEREKGPSTRASEGEEEDGMDEDMGDDEYAVINVKRTVFAPQVRFDPVTGETIIDEDSLAVDREKVAAMEEGERLIVVETDREFSNSRSYAKKSTGERWSKEETAMFYDALAQYGTDFNLITRVLPGRTRRQILSKFKAEDRRNPTLITRYVNGEVKVPIDVRQMERATGMDLSGPIPEITAPSAAGSKSTNVEEDVIMEDYVDEEGKIQTRIVVRKQSRTPAKDVGDLSTEGDGQESGAASTSRGETHESWTPPPLDEVLGTRSQFSNGSPQPSAGGPTPITLAGPSRSKTITASSRTSVASTSKPPSTASSKQAPPSTSQKPASSSAKDMNAAPGKKKGKKPAVAEDGVEILGLIDDEG